MEMGYVQIPREIRGADFWKRLDDRAVYIDLFFMARWQNEPATIHRNGVGVSVSRGQVLTSYGEIGQTLDKSTSKGRQKARRITTRLQHSGHLHKDTVGKAGILVTISHYGQWQNDNDTITTQSETRKEHDTDTSSFNVNNKELITPVASLSEREKVADAKPKNVKKPKPEPQAWSLAIAEKVATHCRDRFGINPSAPQIRTWALRAESLVRSTQFTPKLSAQELSAIFEWGMADDFWSQQIQSVKPAPKMVSIVARYRSRKHISRSDQDTYQPMADDDAFSRRERPQG